MDMDSGKKFSSSQEEIQFWRELAQKFKTELEECKEEAEEYQISSRELEAELEAQLGDLESKNKDLMHTNSKMRTEVESLRDKLSDIQGKTHKELTEMESDLSLVRAYNEELQRYIRELEQANDDLERGKRATVASLEEFEIRLNQAIERNAFLESELDEKETLVDTVQRLKDEARDLRQEMNVKKRPLNSDSLDTSIDLNNSNVSSITMNKIKPVQVVAAVLDQNKLIKSELGATVPPQSTSIPSYTRITKNPTGPGFGSPMAPSARISALNIVGDLLRKVGALETKLASCRSYIKDPPTFGRRPSDSPLNSPRTRRRHLNRGASVPQGPISKIPV